MKENTPENNRIAGSGSKKSIYTGRFTLRYIAVSVVLTAVVCAVLAFNIYNLRGAVRIRQDNDVKVMRIEGRPLYFAGIIFIIIVLITNWIIALGAARRWRKIVKERNILFETNLENRRMIAELLKKDKIVLEQKIGEQTSEIEEMQKALTNARRLADIGRLGAIIAHELRNPLTVIKMAVYNLKEDGIIPSSSAHFENINKKISQCDQIIKNLLGYSKIKMPEYKNVQIFNLLDECIKDCLMKYHKNRIKIEQRYDGPKDAQIECDETHITELFSNILDNACQALPDYTGNIKIIADYKTDDGVFNVSFRDNGMGMDKKDLAMMFEPFFSKKSYGIGLGLTVCHQVVTMHGGRISFESEKGKGTTVFVTLPIKRHVPGGGAV